jgi:hypothetical protein
VTYRLRAEGSGFVASAPKVFVFDAVVGAARDRVFEAIVADPETWRAWCPGVTGGHYESAVDHGVGATRFLMLAGTRVRETVIEHEEPHRWAYRVDTAAIPIARAIVETWRLEDLPDGTHVRWTLAIDPMPLFSLVPFPRTTIGAGFRRGMRNLDERLQPAS